MKLSDESFVSFSFLEEVVHETVLLQDLPNMGPLLGPPHRYYLCPHFKYGHALGNNSTHIHEEYQNTCE